MTIKNLTAKDVNAAINKIPDVKEQDSLSYLTNRISEYAELVKNQAEENNKLMNYCIEMARRINAEL